MAVAKFTLGAEGDIDAFEDYIFSLFESTNYKDLINYWIKTLDDTNTPFPTAAPTESASPTSAPTTNIEYATTNDIQKDKTTKNGDIVIESNKKESNEMESIIILICIVGGLVIVCLIGFVGYKCYKRKKSGPNLDAVRSRSEYELNDIDGEVIDETTKLTPQSTHL